MQEHDLYELFLCLKLQMVVHIVYILIVPLDLRNAPSVLTQLFQIPWYKQHIQGIKFKTSLCTR